MYISIITQLRLVSALYLQVGLADGSDGIDIRRTAVVFREVCARDYQHTYFLRNNASQLTSSKTFIHVAGAQNQQTASPRTLSNHWQHLRIVVGNDHA